MKTISLRFLLSVCVLVLFMSQTSAIAQKKKPKAPPTLKKEKIILLKGGTVWTVTGKIIKNGDVLIKGSKILKVGKNLKAIGAQVIDAKGKHITPGLIDTHSHLGVYGSPHVRATADGNEMTRPVTAYAWAEFAFWPRDPAIQRAVAGGCTTAQILPGSGNLIGGRSAVLKFRRVRSVMEMKVKGAPFGLKMACGENPKRVHRSIMSRMGSYAGYRKAFLKAKVYSEKWKKYKKKLKKWKAKKEAKAKKEVKATSKPSTLKQVKAQRTAKKKKLPAKPKAKVASKKKQAKKKKKPAKKPTKPSLNHGLETLRLVLAGKILVHIHCYRADEMLLMIRLSKEFGFKVRSFHHAVEAYKIRDILAKEKISASVWADWWGFKLEAYDGIQENAAMLSAAGAITIIHSDSSLGIQRLNQNMARAYFRGKAMGLPITKNQAMRWITMNAAWALGIAHKVGSLETGKDADIVIWDGDPFSIYTQTERVFIEGKQVYKKGQPTFKSDFELGQGPIQPKKTQAKGGK